MLLYLHLFPETITLKYSWTLALRTHSHEDHRTLFFYKNQQKCTLGLLFLKFSWFLEYIVLKLFLLSPIFKKFFHNAVMIYNTRNRSNDRTESQEEKKAYFNARARGK